MPGIIKKVTDVARKYTTADYAFFKLLMISFGIILGIYLTLPLMKIIWLIWVVFAVSAIWMIVKIVRYW